MDASDDRDVKLQRASADLLADIQRSLPKFLWHSPKANESSRNVRRRVRSQDVDSLVKLLEPFQEWPQLLDPHLASFLPQIVHAFLESLRSPTSQHITRVANDTFGKSRTVPISRAICQLLYTLCKIRGEKVISQFLSNEPKYLEPLLSAFEAWDIEGEIQEEASEKQDGPMTWFKKYIILLWLSHLLLAPFDLASISSDGSSEDTKPDIPGLAVPPGLPGIARRLLPICFKHIVSASKERDSTRTLLVRLSLRPDMRRLGLVQSLMHWASSTLESQPADGRWASIYQHVGVLSFVAGVLVSADKEVVGPFLLPVFQLWQRILLEEKSLFENIRSSALARKILIKIAQSVTVLILQPGMSRHVPEDNVSQILEDVIDHLLKALADKDTPVRYAASKALSVIATALEPEMAAEVVEAVLGSMKEDLLWEHEPRGVSLTDFELNMIEARSLKPSYSAVNPLRWHGLTLTLAHLLFRRSPAPEQLPEVLNALILALAFEQRSSTSSSVGTNVRDSACFGIWSLARRYSTAELSPVDSSAIHANNSSSKLMSVLQVLAIELVVAGSLDPSGNIRRGSSAALQELIGRHPDTIIEGISIVQVVDYHAVALRSRAATEVAIDASKLGDCYWEATLIGLLGWRGIGSPDAESRRLASRSIGLLSLVRSSSRVCKMIDNILKQLLNKRLPVVEERHGLLLSLAEIMNHTRQATCTASSMELGNQAVISSIWMLFNNGSLMSTKNFVSAALRPELTAEAACHLISAMAQWTHHQSNDGPSEADLDACISVLSLCLHRGEEVVISSTASAASDLFPILTPPKQAALVRSWVICLDRDAKGRQLGAERELGHIAALGAVFSQFSAKSRTNGLAPEQDLIVDSLVAHITLSFSVEAKVAALDSVAAGPMVSKGIIVQSIQTSLGNYTIDQRGDVGSWVRLAAIDAVAAAARQGVLDSITGRDELLAGVCRLAAEKLDKVRIRAWGCLQWIWSRDQVATAGFDGVGQVSSHEYYLELLGLLHMKSLRLPLLEGYVTSAGAGSEALLITSRGALIDFAAQCCGDYNLQDLCVDLVEVLSRNSSNDRIAVPAMEVLSFFLFDTGFAARLEEFQWRSLFSTVQKAHFKSGNMHKLEAAVKIYAGLLDVPEVRKDAAEKLLGMLLHRFSQVRNAVADSLWVGCGNERLKGVDWGAPPRELRLRGWEELKGGILREFRD